MGGRYWRLNVGGRTEGQPMQRQALYVHVNFIKLEVQLNSMYKFSAYRAVNTRRLDYCEKTLFSLGKQSLL